MRTAMVSGIVLMLLAGSAAPARAWVAWVNSTLPSKDMDRWSPAGSTVTLAECHEAALTAAQNIARRWAAQGMTLTREDNIITTVLSSGEKAYHRLICLPDTMDPRIPPPAGFKEVAPKSSR